MRERTLRFVSKPTFETVLDFRTGMDATDSVVERARARVGTLLAEKWTLDALIGVGGMAAVYAATHRNSKRAAIKILHRELSIHDEIRERFLREGYAANQVNHSGVVTVHDDVVTDDGSAFLVMDLLDGETLDARLERKGRLEVDEVLDLSDRVLDVIQAAHEKGIIHRDLKPENVILTRDGAVKVLDFGIARVHKEARRGWSTTADGVVLGTPAFMAPEQARGTWEDVDGRTDVFAIGATMFNLLSGELVHDARTLNESVALAVTARARSLEAVLPSIDPRVTALVDRALAYEKSERWPDPRAMQEALRRTRADLRSGHSQRPPEPYTRTLLSSSAPRPARRPHPHRRPFAAITFVVALVAWLSFHARGGNERNGEATRAEVTSVLATRPSQVSEPTAAPETSSPALDTGPAPPPSATAQALDAPRPSTPTRRAAPGALRSGTVPTSPRTESRPSVPVLGASEELKRAVFRVPPDATERRVPAPASASAWDPFGKRL